MKFNLFPAIGTICLLLHDIQARPAEGVVTGTDNQRNVLVSVVGLEADLAFAEGLGEFLLYDFLHAWFDNIYGSMRLSIDGNYFVWLMKFVMKYYWMEIITLLYWLFF